MLTKVCTKCCIEKEIDLFYKSKDCKLGVSSVCKSCKSDYYAQNRKSITAQQGEYYKQNRVLKSSIRKQHYIQNREDILWYQKNQYRQNRGVIIDRTKHWQKQNPDKVNAISARRKAQKLQATPSWVDNEAVNSMYNLAFLFNMTGINLHVDHIVPLQSDKVCGLHCEANLQLLPASDNISKGNRWWPDMW